MISGIFTFVLFSASTSLVRVSFSFATAPRSPAFSSGTCVCVFPCRTSKWPNRSALSRVWLWTLLSCFNVPEITRSIVMRPANGSAMVFQTNAVYGGLSDALIVLASPLSVTAGNSRSIGDGT